MFNDYIIYEETSIGCKARVISNPKFNDGWETVYFPDADPANVNAMAICGVANEEIFFNEELAGPDGMSFLLFIEPDHTREQVAAAKQWLRHSRDVVRIYTKRITEWVKEPTTVEE